MRAPRIAWLKLRSLFRRRQVDAELDAELRDHLERTIDQFRANGLSQDDARYAALREFGNVWLVREQAQQTRRMSLVEDLWRDAGYALRSMRRAPGFTIAAVLSLGLGVGANTAIFSLVNVLMLRDLPVANPEELVELGRGTQYGSGGAFSYPIYERVRDENRGLRGVALISTMVMRATVEHTDDVPVGRFVSGNLFDVLGFSPAAGRLLMPADDRVDAPADAAVTVIGHALWQRTFGGTPDVVGRTLTIEKVPFTIVGVLPKSFEGVTTGRAVDFLIPMASEPRVRRQSWLGRVDFNWLAMIGRLKEGVTPETAEADLQGVFGRVMEEFAATITDPDDQRRIRAHRIFVQPGGAGLSIVRRQFATPALLLMGAVSLILLIACANVVNLLLARGVARRREISVRLAIGASRGRLVRQFLAESITLGLIGGAAGLALAALGTRLIAFLIADGDPQISFDLAPDARLLLFTALVSIGSALLAGIAPAVRASRSSVAMTDQADARMLHSSRTATVWTRVLISAQVALSLLLLTGATLLITSMRNLYAFDAGFESANVLQMGLDPGRAGYVRDRQREYYRQVLERIRAAPGVLGASLSYVTPVSGGGVDLSIEREGRAREPGASVYVNAVSDGYFRTMGTRLVGGRDLSATDGPDSTRVAVVNEALVRRYLGDENPIGQRVKLGGDLIEIVGVVANAKYMTLREEDHPTVYPHVLQRTDPPGLVLAIRTAGDAIVAAPALRREVQSVAGAVPVERASTLLSQIDRSLVRERLVSRILNAFAALALLLSSVGLYGVLGYAVTRRTNEIGVRLALGASPAAVLRSVVGESWRLVAIGSAVGVPAVLLLTRFLSTYLYGVTATDPWIITGAVTCLFLVALAAAWLPARRASHVDPLIALRQ